MTAPSAQPRILALLPDLPYPQRAGGQMRMMSILDALSSCSQLHALTRTCALPNETIKWCSSRGFTIASVPWPALSVFQRVRNKISSIRSAGVPDGDPETQGLINAAIRDFKPDLIWSETPYLLSYALNQGIPVITDFWGTSEGAERNRLRSTGLPRLWHNYHCHAAQQFERHIVPQLAAAVVVSDHLARLLQNVTGASNIRTVPTALVDPPAHSEPTTPSTREPTIILTGVMSFPPNVDAARFMICDILPGILKRCPETRLILAGSDPSDELRRLAATGPITLTGAVENLHPLIQRAAVYALPMRLGSGIRTKLLEVFPTGTPIVTTSVGAEGYDLVHGRNCLVAESAADFTDACTQLLTNPSLAATLGGQAQELARHVHTQEQVRRSIQAVIHECLATTAHAETHGGPPHAN